MKKYLSILIILTLSFSCLGQSSEETEAKRVLDSIISKIKTHSIHKDNVDWVKLEKISL